MFVFFNLRKELRLRNYKVSESERSQLFFFFFKWNATSFITDFQEYLAYTDEKEVMEWNTFFFPE